MTFESVDYGDEDEATVPEPATASAVAPMSDERLAHLTQVFVDQDPRDWFAKDGLANVIRELLGEAKLQRDRAETAERELAELRELAGNPTYQWASSAPGFFFGPPLLDEADVRRVVSEINAGGGHAVLKRRLVGDWTEVDGG